MRRDPPFKGLPPELREAANEPTDLALPPAAAPLRERAPLGTWSVVLDTGMGYCSPQACAVLGVPRGFAPGVEELLDCFAPESRAGVKRTFLRCIDEGSCFDVEAQVLRPGGDRVWVRLTCEADWDAATGTVRLQGAVQDVTRSVQALEDLGESQRALTMLISNLPGMAYRCGNAKDWPLEFASDGAWDLTGYRPAQLQAGEPEYGSLIHPRDQQRVWLAVQDALDRRERFQLTYRLRTATGQTWVWEQGCGVFRADGSLRCIEGFICDISHAKQIQADLNRLNSTLETRVQERTAQLEAANAELEAFAHSIAHDLRAPMTSLAGFARLLERALPGHDERAPHYLGRIMANVTRMSDLTDALLALARLSGVDILHQPVDLGEQAQVALDLLREQDPGRAVHAVVAPGLQAWGDPRLLQQVLSNLVGNAWKFSREREVIELEVGSGTPGEDGLAVFHVRDRGVGFDMAHAGDLFGPFRRLHASSDFEGMGIGLALVRKIVQRHGGRVWAESSPGAGTTIFFSLPVPPAGAQSANTAAIAGRISA